MAPLQLKKWLKSMRLFAVAVHYSLLSRHLARRFMHHDVPYFSQFEPRELVGKILAGSVKAENDPKWRTSGAETKAEYAAWCWAACGMACFRMILAHRGMTSPSLVALGKMCVRYGGYDLPLEQSMGLKYAPFVTFAKDEFDIAAKAVAALPMVRVVVELARGNYVIASVDPAIRRPASRSKQRGGHLVLVLGYDLDAQELYLHNPSGHTAASQEYATVSFKDFERFFNHQGIVIAG